MKNKILLILTFLNISCVSFDKDLLNQKPLNENNLNLLNGIYSVKPTVKEPNIQTKRQIRMSNNLITNLNRKLLKHTLKIDSTKDYKARIKLLSNQQIEVVFYENEKIMKTQNFKTKLKKDGYLYLKNQNIKPVLIPYIAGALDISKTRFGLTAENNLIADFVKHRSGAFLLIAFLDGTTSKFRLEYEREK